MLLVIEWHKESLEPFSAWLSLGCPRPAVWVEDEILEYNEYPVYAGYFTIDATLTAAAATATDEDPES